MTDIPMLKSITLSIVIFAVQANFAPGGVSGIAVILNYLFGAPIGLMTVIVNIPIILCTFRKLGLAFFLHSIKTVLINAVFADYVVVHLPMYEGSRLLAAILSGVFAGVAYALAMYGDPLCGGMLI